MISTSATGEWRALLAVLLHSGADVAPMSAGANFKGRTSRELLAMQSHWDMARPVIVCPARKLGYRFMTAEAAWTLGGDNRLATIKPFGKHIARFTDDGIHMQGAYGPPFVDQVSHVVRTLAEDVNTRQAVCTIWRPRPGPTNDTPCTVALQWMIRDYKLHCVVTMRSSDAWTGIPYDVFNFSMMSVYVALSLREYLKTERAKLYAPPRLAPPILPLSLGELHLTAGSQHLYMQDHDDARLCIDRGDEGAVMPIDLDEFAGPQDLVDYLWHAARKGIEPGYWLGEVCPPKEGAA